MLFYLSLLFFVVISSFMVSFAKKKPVVLLFKIFTYLLITVPATIRYGIGTDYFNYIDIFYLLQYGAIDIEEGFAKLNLFVHSVGGNAQDLIALMSILTSFVFFVRVPNKYWYIYAPLFIIVAYGWYFTSLRQMFSMSIAFYCWLLLEEEKSKKNYLISVILLLLAFSFHSSSILYPIFYFLINIKTDKKAICILSLVVFIVTYIFSGTVITYIDLIVRNTFYARYADSSRWFAAPDMGTGLSTLAMYILYFIVLLFYPVNKENNKVYNLFFLYYLFAILTSQIEILNRISRGVIFIILIVVKDMIYFDYRYKKIIVLCIYLILFAYFIATLLNESPNLIPYKTVNLW